MSGDLPVSRFPHSGIDNYCNGFLAPLRLSGKRKGKSVQMQDMLGFHIMGAFEQGHISRE